MRENKESRQREKKMRNVRNTRNAAVAVDLKADGINWPSEGQNGITIDVVCIPVGTLDPSAPYQADRLYTEHMHNIADNWDPIRCDVLRISFRDSRYYILDGKHRRGAALEKFGPAFKIPCIVYTGLTYEEEAHYYHTQRDVGITKNFTPVQKLKGATHANEKLALDIVDVLAKHGVELRDKPGTKVTNAATTVKRIYKTEGKEVLDEFIGYLINIWNGDYYSMMQGFVSGFWAFYSRYADTEEFCEKHMCNAFKKNTAQWLWEESRKEHRSTGDNKMVAILFDKFNYGRSERADSKRKKLVWAANK